MKNHNIDAYTVSQAVWELAVNKTEHDGFWEKKLETVMDRCGGRVSLTFDKVNRKPRGWFGWYQVTFRVDGGASEYTVTGVTRSQADTMSLWLSIYKANRNYEEGVTEYSEYVETVPPDVKPYLVTYPHYDDGMVTVLVMHTNPKGAETAVITSHWEPGLPPPCKLNKVKATPVLDHGRVLSGLTGLFKPFEQVVGAMITLGHPGVEIQLLATGHDHI